MRFPTAFHQSDLSHYARYCALATYLIRVQQQAPNSRSPRAIAGSMIHWILAHFSKEKWDAETNKPQLIDIAWTYCRQNPRNPAEKDVPIDWWPNDTVQYAELKRDALAMLEGFYKNCPPHIATFQEQDFKCKIGKYDFEGTIDQIWAALDDFKKNDCAIVDFKSGRGKMPADDTILESYQAAVYALGIEQSLGIHATHFIWVNLRDFMPYAFSPNGKNKLNYKEVQKSKNQAMKDWITREGRPLANKETGELTGKYAFESGQLRGPGLYIYELTPEWWSSREYIITSAAGALSQVNPIPFISEACEICSVRLQCRAKIYGRQLDPKQLRQFEEYLTEE